MTAVRLNGWYAPHLEMHGAGEPDRIFSKGTHAGLKRRYRLSQDPTTLLIPFGLVLTCYDLQPASALRNSAATTNIHL